MSSSLLGLPENPEELGFVLPHEHVAVRWPAMALAYPEKYSSVSILNRCVDKLSAARDAGVTTIFDASTIDMARDIHLVTQVAERTGMRVIMCTGFYTDVPQYFRLRPRAEMTSFLLHELREGIGETEVRAHFVKFSCDGVFEDRHERVAACVAEAAIEANAPVYLHTDGVARNAPAIISFFIAQGVEPSSIYVGHVDEAMDIDYARHILDTGCFAGFDKTGVGSNERTAQKFATVASLANEGYINRLLLSHDASGYMDLANMDALDSSQPSWRHDFIPTSGLNLLEEGGLSPTEIDQITHVNPARWIYTKSLEGDK